MLHRNRALDRWSGTTALRGEAAVADQRMVGKEGRVTGTISPGRIGEVMVSVRGGTEHFHAYATDADDTITRGTRIVVVDYLPPRTVVVTPA
jgi:membrane protein implicated in regulation of membrane protease activity